MLFDEDQVTENMFDDAYALHFCSVSLGDFPMKEAHRTAIEMAARKDAIISFDPNLRFPLWKSKKELFKTVHEFIPMADIIKISDEELEFLTEEKEIENALPQLFAGNVKLIIYTCGSKGAYAYTRTEKAFSPCEEVKAVDTTGAGDGFIGSFLFGLKSMGKTKDALEKITGPELEKILHFSNRFCGESVKCSGAINSYKKIQF